MFGTLDDGIDNSKFLLSEAVLFQSQLVQLLFKFLHRVDGHVCNVSVGPGCRF